MGTQAPIADNNSTVKTTMIGMVIPSAGGCDEPGSVLGADGDG